MPRRQTCADKEERAGVIAAPRASVNQTLSLWFYVCVPALEAS